MLTSYVLKQYEITYLPNIEAVVFANLMIGLRALWKMIMKSNKMNITRNVLYLNVYQCSKPQWEELCNVKISSFLSFHKKFNF